MFFFPFLLSIRTRYNSLSKVIVYFITYIIPLFLLSFLQNYPDSISDSNFYIVFFLTLVSYVNLYEIGYIYNEGETIKNEVDPTKRLSDRELFFYEKYKFEIYCERVLLSIVLNYLLAFFITIKSILLFSMMELVSLFIFFMYNTIRGKITQFIYFFLSVAKYSAILFCFSEKVNMSLIIAAIFMFPIVRTIEYKAHYTTDSDVNVFFRKYVIKYDVSNITIFRVWATFFLLIVSILLYYEKICNFIPIVCCAYMFMYRFFLFVLIKCGIKFKGYLKR